MNERTLPAWAADLPARYREHWLAPFNRLVGQTVREGATILDVGAGRSPVLPPDRRPHGCTYVGLDISETELAAAPSGAYDEVFVGDIIEHLSSLDARFDIVLSWQVLEHVKPLPVALENIRMYLKPDGRFIGQFSGKFSAFGVLNQLIPHRAASWVLHRLIGRDSATVFPAPYHRCWRSAIELDTKSWRSFEIVPRYTGAKYFKFMKPLRNVYLVYEEWALRNNHDNLATHYLVIGSK